MSEPSLLDGELDAELLLIIYAGDKTDCRDRAANIFYERHFDHLFKFCHWKFRYTLGGEEVVSDLVIMTFQCAFECADKFDDNGILDIEHSRARTFRWLTTIATNLMQDWLKGSREKHPLRLTRITNQNRQVKDTSVDHVTTERNTSWQYDRLPDNAADKIQDPSATRQFIGNEDELHPTVSQYNKCLQKALKILTEREREIILLSAEYSVDGKQLRLPSDVLTGLCKSWGTTKENIRAIRKRALDKIKGHVKMYQELSP